MDEWRKEVMEIYNKYQGTLTGKQALEMRKEINRVTICGIYDDATKQSPFKSVDDAEYAALQFGHEYRHIWLKANTEAGNLDDPYIKYYTLLYVYSTAPYNSLTKKTMTDLLKIRPDDYLKDMNPDTPDPLTVYRGGAELTEREAGNALSWTMDINTAIFFYNRRFDAAQLWKAQIYKKDIIAYYDGRGENEVIQYRKVKNIEPLELTAEEIATALDERKKKMHEKTGLNYG